jgi:hypothetical protein
MILGIQPIAGLANRMRVIESALEMVDDFNLDLKIYWRKSPACNCAFDKLFKTPERTKIIENYSPIRDGGKIDQIFNKWKKFYNTFFVKEYDHYLYFSDIIKMKNSIHDFSHVFTSETFFIQSFNDFYKKSKSELYLKPSDSMIEKINEICDNRFAKRTIGIHIRRTDNKRAIESSPDILFFNKIDEELSLFPDTKFFLATDSQTVENDFKSRYGDKMIVLKKKLNRYTEEGIITAFIDFLCLSRTLKIYGTFYSSFSVMAAEFGKIELCVLKNDNV